MKNTQTQLPKPEFIRLKDAIRYSGLSRSFLYDRFNAGDIKSFVIRQRGAAKGVRMVSVDSIDQYLRAEMVRSQGNARKPSKTESKKVTLDEIESIIDRIVMQRLQEFERNFRDKQYKQNSKVETFYNLQRAKDSDLLTTLGLSDSHCRKLKSAGFATVGDICCCDKDWMFLKHRNYGKKSLWELKRALKDKGRYLGDVPNY